MDNLLKCSYCLGPFKDPRLLPSCSHSFCLTCIEKINGEELLEKRVCPIDSIALPSGLDMNELTKNLLSVVICENLKPNSSGGDDGKNASEQQEHHQKNHEKKKDQENTQPMCECEENPATLFCSTCGDLCQDCSKKIHARRNFTSHTIVEFKEKEKLTSPTSSSSSSSSSNSSSSNSSTQQGQQAVLLCSEHDGYKLDIYCSTCSKSICHLCERASHTTHSTSSLAEAADKVKTNLIKFIQPFHNKKPSLTTKVAKLDEEMSVLSNKMEQLKRELDAVQQQVESQQENKRKLVSQLNQVDFVYNSLVSVISEKRVLELLDKKSVLEMKTLFKSAFNFIFQENLKPSFGVDPLSASPNLVITNNGLTLSHNGTGMYANALGNCETNESLSWKFQIKSQPSGKGSFISIGLVDKQKCVSSFKGTNMSVGDDIHHHIGFLSPCTGAGLDEFSGSMHTLSSSSSSLSSSSSFSSVPSSSESNICPGWKINDIVGFELYQQTLSFYHNETLVKSFPFKHKNWIPVISITENCSVTLIQE